MDFGFVSSWIPGRRRTVGKRPGLERNRRRCAVDCGSVPLDLRQSSVRARLGGGESARRRLLVDAYHGLLAQDTGRPCDGAKAGVPGDGKGPGILGRVGEKSGVAAALGVRRRSRKYRRFHSQSAKGSRKHSQEVRDSIALSTTKFEIRMSKSKTNSKFKTHEKIRNGFAVFHH